MKEPLTFKMTLTDGNDKEKLVISYSNLTSQDVVEIEQAVSSALTELGKSKLKK